MHVCLNFNFPKKCEPKIIQSTSHAIWKQSVNKSSIIDCILNEYDALLMPSPKMGCLKCPIGLWVVSHFINSSHWMNRYREQKMKHFFVPNKKYGVRFFNHFFYLVGIVEHFERVLMYFPRNVSACDIYVSISLINWINWFILTWKWIKKNHSFIALLHCLKIIEMRTRFQAFKIASIYF